jgi:transposase
MRYESDLSDAQWELVRPFVESRMGRPAKVDRREVLNAIFYVLRTGCQWRMLPKEFPHWSTVSSLLLLALAAQWHIGFAS